MKEIPDLSIFFPLLIEFTDLTPEYWTWLWSLKDIDRFSFKNRECWCRVSLDFWFSCRIRTPNGLVGRST